MKKGFFHSRKCFTVIVTIALVTLLGFFQNCIQSDFKSAKSQSSELGPNNGGNTGSTPDINAPPSRKFIETGRWGGTPYDLQMTPSENNSHFVILKSGELRKYMAILQAQEVRGFQVCVKMPIEEAFQKIFVSNENVVAAETGIDKNKLLIYGIDTSCEPGQTQMPVVGELALPTQYIYGYYTSNDFNTVYLLGNLIKSNSESATVLYAIDISTKANPQIVGTLELSGNESEIGIMQSFVEIGQNTLVMSYYDSALAERSRIIDTTNKQELSILATVGAGIKSYAVKNNTIFYTNENATTWFTMDLTNPSAPSITPRAFVEGEVGSQGIVGPMQLIGDFLYIYYFAPDGNSLVVFDVSDEGEPEAVDININPNNTFSRLDLVRAADISSFGPYVVTSGHLNPIGGGEGTSGVSVIDVSTPEAPVMVAQSELASDFRGGDFYHLGVFQSFVAVTNGWGGMFTFDISQAGAGDILDGGSFDNLGGVSVLESNDDGSLLFVGSSSGFSIHLKEEFSDGIAELHHTPIDIYSVSDITFDGGRIFYTYRANLPMYDGGMLVEVAQTEPNNLASFAGISSNQYDFYQKIDLVGDLLYGIHSGGFNIRNVANNGNASNSVENVAFSLEDFRVAGNVLVLDSNKEIYFYDVTNPMNPQELASFDNFFGQQHTTLEVIGTRAYVLDYIRGLVVIDFTNPADIKIIKEYDGYALSGSYPVKKYGSFLQLSEPIYEVKPGGGVGFKDVYFNTIEIIDVSNPANITVVDRIYGAEKQLGDLIWSGPNDLFSVQNGILKSYTEDLSGQ